MLVPQAADQHLPFGIGHVIAVNRDELLGRHSWWCFGCAHIRCRSEESLGHLLVRQLLQFQAGLGIVSWRDSACERPATRAEFHWQGLESTLTANESQVLSTFSIVGTRVTTMMRGTPIRIPELEL